MRRMQPAVLVGVLVGLAACGGARPEVTAGEAGRIMATNPAPAAPIVTPPATVAPTPALTPDTGERTTPETLPGVAPSAPAPIPPPVTEPPTTPAPPVIDPLPGVAQLQTAAIATQQVADLRHPLAMAWNPADGSLYVAGQDGVIWRFDETGTPQVVLDLVGRVTPFAPGSERGLLGMAFGPDGRLFLNLTDLGDDTNVVSMAMNGITPDPATEWPVLFVEQPGVGHNGGNLVFDRAGNLYVGMGDGGGSNGRDAQDPSKLLGTILRIHPTADGPGYDIPPDNPFVGHPSIRPEKWVYGFRNPWKFSIDDDTGDLWLGDVGNSEWEEIDRVPAGGQGANYGWYWFEGNHRRRSGAPADVVAPVWEWSHQVGVAAVGGYVYRGSAIPQLRGAYVFGDLTGTVWALGVDGVERLPIRLKGLDGFGEDPTGELWMTSIWGPVVKIVPA